MAERGGYYWNSLRNWKKELDLDLIAGEHRTQTLVRIGSSCLADHSAAMAVRRAMLKVVTDALAKRADA